MNETKSNKLFMDIANGIIIDLSDFLEYSYIINFNSTENKIALIKRYIATVLLFLFWSHIMGSTKDILTFFLNNNWDLCLFKISLLSTYISSNYSLLKLHNFRSKGRN